MLPTEKTAPKKDTADFTVLIYGPSGIGKSTWCSNAEGALFVATESGLNALNVFQVPVTTWEEFLTCCGQVAEGKHKFKTVIIDTIDNAYKMCADYICRKFNILHQSDLEYGKGWALVNNEFQRMLVKVSALPYGLYLVSHSIEREIDTRTGKHLHTRPTLPDKMREILLGMVDVIGFCDVEPAKEGDESKGYTRVMRTKPSPYYEAKDRTGKLPETLPLDFGAFRKAFTAATNAKSGRAK